jgi:triacylglycerol lipase
VAVFACLGPTGCAGIDEDVGKESITTQVQEIAGVAAPVLENDYPYVLVHGFFGWGRDELLGWKHFGGRKDIQQDLRAHGYETYTVALGPISSNWDRVAEMYAQLVGGTVDYGHAHARRYGHARFGRTYPGMLPQLGTPDGRGEIRKVNIISHSMGAQTARVLVELLAHGSDAERAACPAGVCPPERDGQQASLSPLYAGTAGSWVHSIGALSGANNGSTVAHIIEQLGPNEIVSAIVKLVNAFGADGLYDFKLDQFGLEGRRNGETLHEYANRMVRAMIDGDSQDSAFYDLSLAGAARLNAWTPADPGVFYFSWTNSSSRRGVFTARHFPVFQTNLLLRPMVNAMGHYGFDDFGLGVDCAVWWENDGVVNTISMAGPTLGSSDEIRAYDPVHVQPGCWQVVSHRNRWDHWDMLGLVDSNHAPERVLQLYRSVAQLLRGGA